MTCCNNSDYLHSQVHFNVINEPVNALTMACYHDTCLGGEES